MTQQTVLNRSEACRDKSLAFIYLFLLFHLFIGWYLRSERSEQLGDWMNSQAILHWHFTLCGSWSSENESHRFLVMLWLFIVKRDSQYTGSLSKRCRVCAKGSLWGWIEGSTKVPNSSISFTGHWRIAFKAAKSPQTSILKLYSRNKRVHSLVEKIKPHQQAAQAPRFVNTITQEEGNVEGHRCIY